MRKQQILKYAVIDSAATALYIIIVASFMYFGSQGMFGTEDTILAPIVMLMLFVFSAALTGSLMFGKPVMWYLEGKRREALSLLVYTLAVFFVMTIIALLILIAVSA